MVSRQQNKGPRSRTRRDIKQGLMRLLETKRLEEITMSELAREAQVSRNTLYRHYQNIATVYADIVVDSTTMMSKALAKPYTSDEGQTSLTPFCELVRSESEYSAAIHDPRFIDAIFEGGRFLEGHPMYYALVEAGYSPKVAEGMVRFQTQGCFQAASLSSTDEAGWIELRSCIDTFVRGGLDACIRQKKMQQGTKTSETL